MAPPTEVLTSVEAVFRREHGRIIASLIRLCGSFDRAEEAMQEALAAALAHWPRRGIPENPAAWIMTAAHRKLIDMARRERTRTEKRGLLEQDAAVAVYEHPMPAFPVLPDDRLSLIFACCHPALNREAQVALTLRTLGGLSTGEIARAFLVPEPTLAQRLLHDSRRHARVDGEGALVTLEDQDRSLWDRDQIREGLPLIAQALRIGRIGTYQLQAAIAALHAEAKDAAETDWAQIAVLYDELA